MSEHKKLTKSEFKSTASARSYVKSENQKWLKEKNLTQINNLQSQVNDSVESPCEFTKRLKQLKTLDESGSEAMQKRTFTKWINYHLEMVIKFYFYF